MTWALYLLQVNIYIVVFYVFYRIFLDRETWFVLNRIYLLAAGTFSMLIPFIKPEWIISGDVAPVISISAGQLEMMVIEGAVPESTGFNWGGMISTIYVCGVILFTALLIWRLIHVRLLISANQKGMAFSFFGRKVIDQRLPGQKTIHVHEDVHVRQFHTADVVYFELLGILLWCNPIIYLYKKSIKNIHEYLADEVAAQIEGDKESYAMLLLCKAFKVDKSVLTNSFFTQSLIKNRIYMLNKQRSTKTAILKYGLFLPLFAGMLLLSSAKISRNEEIKDLAEKIPAAAPELFSAINDKAPETTFTGVPAQDTTKKVRKAKLTKVRITAPSDQPGSTGDGTKVYDFTSADTPPSFPGGMEKFYQYLGAAVKYPKEAQDKNVQGKVFLSYIVEKDGRINEVKVVRGLGSGLDEEAVRVLEASPKWIPGKSGDQPVRVKYNLPISFSLSNGKSGSPDMNKAPEVSPAGTKPGYGARISRIEVGEGTKPGLVYVDGVQITMADLKGMDPGTIESMLVLTDETATNRYGAEAKNGVIEITTKSGKKKNTSSSGNITEGHPQYRAY